MFEFKLSSVEGYKNKAREIFCYRFYIYSFLAFIFLNVAITDKCPSENEYIEKSKDVTSRNCSLKSTYIKVTNHNLKKNISFYHNFLIFN